MVYVKIFSNVSQTFTKKLQLIKILYTSHDFYIFLYTSHNNLLER